MVVKGAVGINKVLHGIMMYRMNEQGNIPYAQLFLRSPVLVSKNKLEYLLTSPSNIFPTSQGECSRNAILIYRLIISIL